MKKVVILAVLYVLITMGTASDTGLAAERNDRMTAFLLSCAIPGLGQYYAGSPGSAKLFIAAELAIWSGYYYSTVIKNSYRQDYISCAARYSGVNPEGSGSSFLTALGAFDSSFDSNQYQLQVNGHPILYSGELTWEWESGRDRAHFLLLRERELDYKNYTKYCIAGVILNHFLSGLNAANIAGKHNEQLSVLRVKVLEEGLAANYSWSF